MPNKTARELLEQRGLLDKATVAAFSDGGLYDLHTPVPSDQAKSLRPVGVGDPRALEVIRHSSAHVMADAVQRLYPGTKVTFGPATDGGFYYDFDRPQGPFSEDELRDIEAEMAAIIASDHPFRREEIAKEQARALLQELGETYKLEHLERLEAPISVYRHGNWVDLCKGPHVPSTRFLKAFKLTSVSGAYWRGDERNPMLQRIYGTAFSTTKELRHHLQCLEEAKKRDHRKLGKELDLFSFDALAPASPFFLPRGCAVINALLRYMRELYRQHGYCEVITPQVYDEELFRISGHIPTYAGNMYRALPPAEPGESGRPQAPKASPSAGTAAPEPARFALKPMNCPGHALLFRQTRRSYRELPLRYADFGRLHRYERSGVLQGLTRVRSFAQDDGHIFCTEAQMAGEITGFLNLVNQVYCDFDFHDARVVVATRPDERLGDDALWDRSEAALLEAVAANGVAYEVAEGEGAFYGPKIEFHLRDALDRSWQLGTIQADFNLPLRFDLSYVGDDNLGHRPVMLHRAIFGSLERFFAVLVEHCGGAFPTWIAPESLILLTVSDRFNGYAETCAAKLREAGASVTVDASPDKLGAKIRRARLQRVPWMGVIGEREAEEGSISLRARGDSGGDRGSMPLAAVAELLTRELLPPSQR